MEYQYDAIIVGAGIAGLTAARHLDEYNLKTLVIEAEDRVGGRVKTDNHEGFKLDRGFQVLLTSYPEARRHLDYEALDLQYFQPGALCFNHKRKFRVRDTNRDQKGVFTMPFSPVGSFMDKLRIAKTNARLRSTGLENIFKEEESTTYEYLRKRGFSKKMIERFFRPFLSGIFLEQELSTSSRMFEFVFKMFGEGQAALPAQGMEAIPQQLKSKLKRCEFRFHSPVKAIRTGEVELQTGEHIKGKQIIVATAPDNLLPQMQGETQWNSTACFYFSAPRSLLKSKVIALSYRKEGLINNFAVLSDIAAGYSPNDKVLLVVNLRNNPQRSVEKTATAIKQELAHVFGKKVEQLRYLKNYWIPEALPVPESFQYKNSFEESRVQDGIYLAGDHLLNPSLNAAFISGENAAKALVLNHNAGL